MRKIDEADTSGTHIRKIVRHLGISGTHIRKTVRHIRHMSKENY